MAQASPDAIRQELNIIERIVAELSPQDEYDRALLEAIERLRRALEGVDLDDDDTTAVPTTVQVPAGASATEEQILNQLVGVNQRLEDQIQGITDTTNLPIGATGTATTDIANGNTGIAVLDVAGGTFAANVQADEGIDAEQEIRVIGPNNLVTGVPEDESGDKTGIKGSSPKTDEVTETGQDNDVQIQLGNLRSHFTIYHDADDNSGTVNIRVSDTGDSGSWRGTGDDYSTVNGEDTTNFETYYEYIRVWVSGISNANLNELQVSAKGI